MSEPTSDATGDAMGEPTSDAMGERAGAVGPLRPSDHAVYDATSMGKGTLFRSERVLVGLNAFEPGQQHRLHTHEGMDKVYQVLEGRGTFLLEGREVGMKAGELLVAPSGVAHGIRNDGGERLLVLAILAPSP